MSTGPPPSPPRYGSRDQRLLSRVELAASRSISGKKQVAKRYTNWSKPVPPSLASYAGSSSSGAGSSRRAPSSPPSSSKWGSDASGYHDYMSPEHTDSSDESDGDRIVARDFVDNDEAEERVLARLKRRSECVHFAEEAKDDRELEEASASSIARSRRRKRRNVFGASKRRRPRSSCSTPTELRRRQQCI